MVPWALVFALGVPLGGTLQEAVERSGDGDNLGEVGALEGGPYGVTARLFLTPHLSVSSYSQPPRIVTAAPAPAPSPPQWTAGPKPQPSINPSFLRIPSTSSSHSNKKWLHMAPTAIACAVSLFDLPALASVGKKMPSSIPHDSSIQKAHLPPLVICGTIVP